MNGLSVGNAGVSGRNAGVRACPTRYVAFRDNDTWWDRSSLACAASVLERHRMLAVATVRCARSTCSTPLPCDNARRQRCGVEAACRRSG
jgi:hypothetical protein